MKLSDQLTELLLDLSVALTESHESETIEQLESIERRLRHIIRKLKEENQ